MSDPDADGASASRLSGRDDGDASASGLRTLVAYLQVAAFGGVGVLAAVLFGAFVWISVREGEYGRLALPALLLLVGGPFSVLYLLPVVTDPEARSELTDGMETYRDLSAGHAALAAALGAVGIVAAAGTVGPLAVLAAFALVFGSTLAASTVDPDWTFDPAERTLTYHDLKADLDAAVGTRRIDVGGAAVLWLSYAGPNDLDRPHLVVLPPPVADDVAAAVDREDAADEERPTAERAALIGTAAVFLGLAAVLVAVGRGTENAAALYAFAMMPGAVGALLLYLAA